MCVCVCACVCACLCEVVGVIVGEDVDGVVGEVVGGVVGVSLRGAIDAHSIMSGPNSKTRTEPSTGSEIETINNASILVLTIQNIHI